MYGLDLGGNCVSVIDVVKLAKSGAIDVTINTRSVIGFIVSNEVTGPIRSGIVFDFN